jgi:hypothetical protein
VRGRRGGAAGAVGLGSGRGLRRMMTAGEMIPGRRVNWAARNELGCAEDLGQKRRRKKGEKKSFLLFSKDLTKLEFKHIFGFKQIKTMQQHACNSKLLKFIN